MNTPSPAHDPRRLKLARRGLYSSLGLALSSLLLGGLGFWWIDPGVHSIGDGMWLAFTTAATVGYGDVVPSTSNSRAFAFVVVLLGMAILSLVTAALSAIFNERHPDEAKLLHQQDRDQALDRSMLQELQALRQQVELLRGELAQVRRERGGD